MTTLPVTIAIPTYNRGLMVVDTLMRLFALEPAAAEIVVVDQTPHATGELSRWHDEGRIRWIRMPQPSIPQAMNVALSAASHPLVLFLDDDVIPSPALVAAHVAAHGDDNVWAVVGQILQPDERPQHHAAPADDLEFRFNHDAPVDVANVMAGNLSVKRMRAIAIGGFDENYIGAAYRFETDFALRLVAAGGRIRFEPRASLDHLKLASGGLRSYGDHRSTTSPLHAVGDYYFALHHRLPLWRYTAARLRKNVLTRWHLRHPWAIPTKVIGELRGLLLARRLQRQGRRLMPR